MWQVAAAQAAGKIADAAKAGPSEAHATGGVASGTFDNSGWSVQIGEGNSMQPAGLMQYVMIGAALFLAARWLNKKS